jgi:hypothetical protein
LSKFAAVFADIQREPWPPGSAIQLSLFAGFSPASRVLFTHYWQSSKFNKDAVDEQITLVAASHFSLSQLVDNLPNVFKENPHAAALKITDLRGAFLGAMYDSRRMPATTYKAFLETRAFDLQASPFAGYTLHSWESKRRRLRIVAVNLERMLLSEYLARMGREMAPALSDTALYSAWYRRDRRLSLRRLWLWSFFAAAPAKTWQARYRENSRCTGDAFSSAHTQGTCECMAA